MPTKSKQTGLKEIVGDEVYAVWVAMLLRLVPQGRTHRLAPTIAAMLEYATEVAREKYGDNSEEGTAAYRLFTSGDEDPERAEETLMPLVRRLFKDAGVEYERVSKSGDHYSVAEEAIREYVNWFEYSWDSY